MAIEALQSKLNKALTTNAAGDYALRTQTEGAQTMSSLTMTGDISAGGNYLLNDQTTTNMMSKGTVYRFDGVDDTIAVTSSDMQAVIDSETFTLSAWVYAAGNDNVIFGNNGTAFTLVNRSSNAIGVQINGSTVYVTTELLPQGEWHHIALSVDASGNDTIYLDGIVTSIDAAHNAGWAAATFTTAFGIGSRSDGSVSWDGELAEIALYNIAMSSAEVKDLISGNIPFKWQYGSQTSLHTAFTNSDFDTFTVDGTGFSSAIASAGSQNCYSAFTATAGKVYKFYYDLTVNSGITPGFRISASSALSTPIYSVGAVAGGVTIEWTATASGTLYFGINSEGACDISVADSVTLIPLGAVALYDQTSISETYWYDKANGNNGAVTGASVLNPPSVTPLSCLRSVLIRLQPGGTPGTNINVSDVSSASAGFNYPSITDGTNIAKGASSGSFALSSSGKIITMTTTEKVVGTVSCSLESHDLNNSSTTAGEIYIPYLRVVSGQLTLQMKKVGTGTDVDLTTILQAGDISDILVTFVTSTQ